MEVFETNTQFNKGPQVWYRNLPIEEGQDIEVTVSPIRKHENNKPKPESLEGMLL